MQNKSAFKLYSLSKGKSPLWLLPFFLAVFSCSDVSKQGKITLHNGANKESFVFSVSDDFAQENLDSAPDKKNPKISKAEAALLTKILKQRNYCMAGRFEPQFVITSRQEKVYDMTFAHLIEQNYKARPISPRMYFGECLNPSKSSK